MTLESQRQYSFNESDLKMGLNYGTFETAALSAVFPLSELENRALTPPAFCGCWWGHVACHRLKAPRLGMNEMRFLQAKYTGLTSPLKFVWSNLHFLDAFSLSSIKNVEKEFPLWHSRNESN